MTYDSRNLLSTIALAGVNIDSRSYDTGGRLTNETLGNGQVVTQTYMTGDNLPASINNSAVGNYGYGWDANKNKTSETVTGAMSGYGFSVPTGGYDDQNRLTGWNRTNGTKNQAWALSPVGDWNTFTDAGVAQARVHGPTHEIISIAGAAVLHDSRGNMTQDELGKVMTWDADGMLASVVVPAGSPTGVAGTHSYQYDALGRRVRKTTGGAGAIDTVFVRDGQTVIAEYEAGMPYGGYLRKYVNASYVDEPVLMVDRTAAGALEAGQAENLYYHRNQQYSITALTDQGGSVVERYAYTAYGEPTILDGAGTTTRTASFIGNPYLYTARDYDVESGLYYFRRRMYEGWKGRFLSHDPILYPNGASTYAGWFSLRGIDPFGRDASMTGIEDLVGGDSIDWNNPPWPNQEPRSVCCTFESGGKMWSESVTAYDGDSPGTCCRKRANGTLWDWTVFSSGEGPCSPPSTPPNTPGVTGATELLIGGIGAGTSTVLCLDCGQLKIMTFGKMCFGLGLGAGYATQYVSLAGGCNPDAYSGWFLEFGGSLGPASFGVDVGFNGDMTATSGTWEGGGGPGYQYSPRLASAVSLACGVITGT